MPGKRHHQVLPSSGPEREALREKGQFWTPAWVAEAMVAYVMEDGSSHVFDPAVGAGAFFHAAKAVAVESGRVVHLMGSELHPEALDEARSSGLTDADLENVRIADFVLQPPEATYEAIVANPPYLRHHRLSSEVKAFLKDFTSRLMGKALDGRTGFHVYFLLRALQRLRHGGRLAFIMPADTCEGASAPALWKWIARHYRLDGVVTFEPEATPFPGVDTNAVVFFIRNAPPEAALHWARCTERTSGLKAWVQAGLTDIAPAGVTVRRRDLAEALCTGLSRPPQHDVAGTKLFSFATTSRGIATGANDFFFLTREQARTLEIPSEFLLPAVGRTRDVTADEVTEHTLEALDARGRPTLLLSPDGRPMEDFPPTVRAYLRRGEDLGLPERALIGTRNPWYKMEVRTAPAFLFAYLGRRNARFIRNKAGVVPLTGFLCVYPRHNDPAFIEQLWEALNHPATIANLPLVGKSYGGGAVKVEPRSLEKLHIPQEVLEEAGLEEHRPEQQLALLG